MAAPVCLQELLAPLRATDHSGVGGDVDSGGDGVDGDAIATTTAAAYAAAVASAKDDSGGGGGDPPKAQARDAPRTGTGWTTGRM